MQLLHIVTFVQSLLRVNKYPDGNHPLSKLLVKVLNDHGLRNHPDTKG
jgi:hypothetical protein